MTKRKYYRQYAKQIPWASFGRETPASRVARSVLPVGILPFTPLPPQPDIPAIPGDHPDADKFLMSIVGTAIQAGQGKLVTCAHVMDALVAAQARTYVLTSTTRSSTVVYLPYRVVQALRYVDPRTNQVNPGVDLAVLLVPASQRSTIPYNVPPVHWGDSAGVGVGDPVLIGGYPLGTAMFLSTKSNRGVIQPTFYSGIVSAVLPATKPNEARLFQVSIPTAGGMSGGPMLDPATGEVLGIVTSGIEIRIPRDATEESTEEGPSIPLPMTYVLPSEVIMPYVNTIKFETKDASGKRRIWR